MTLTEFLLARIAEDEESGRHGDCFCGWCGADEPGKYRDARCGDRIMAECEAQRRIVEDFTTLDADYRVTHDDTTAARRFQSLVSLAHLALVYSDHPDYDPAWRP